MIDKFLAGKMDGEMALCGGTPDISILHLFPYEPNGHGKRKPMSKLGKFRIHKVNKSVNMPLLFLVPRCNILGNRSCAHIVPPKVLRYAQKSANRTEKRHFDGFLARMAYVDKKDAKFLRVRFVSLGV